jgi:hypothetical protein
MKAQHNAALISLRPWRTVTGEFWTVTVQAQVQRPANALAGSIVIVAAGRAHSRSPRTNYSASISSSETIASSYYCQCWGQPLPSRTRNLGHLTLPIPSPPGAPATQPGLPYEALCPLEPLPNPNPARRLVPVPISISTHHYTPAPAPTPINIPLFP